LNVAGALDGLNDAGKLGQEPVAHELHDTSLALRDFRLHQLFPKGFQALERSRLILAHEAGIADNVCGKYGGKPAFQALSPSPRRLTTMDRRIHVVGMAVECLLLAMNGPDSS
jgi:hypothetical protein